MNYGYALMPIIYRVFMQVTRRGNNARAKYYCDIQFDNGQFEAETPLLNRRNFSFNILPLLAAGSNPRSGSGDDACNSNEVDSIDGVGGDDADNIDGADGDDDVDNSAVASTAVPLNCSTLPMEERYVPKIGDAVKAHSKGNCEDPSVAVYSDDWFAGKITKVNY